MSGKLNKKMIVLIISGLILLVIAFDQRMVVRHYEMDTDEITNSIRVALITDLHSCRYGKNQVNLIEAIQKQAPDLVLFGGDIFDDVLDDTNTELFLSAISNEYPCYYVTGNHEYWSGEEAFSKKMEILDKYNIPILSATYDTISINGDTINICGVEDPDAYMVEGINKAVPMEEQLEIVEEAAQNGAFTILLSHRPEYFETYTEYDFNLVLCGHAHGGQWRIPLILNGLYAPNQGLFPKYAGGLYEENDTTMIVSRGLARETTRIPRIFNRPELVIVDIN